MNIRAIIFDFNGVLWWDTELQGRAWQDFAIAVRGRPLDEQEVAEYVLGRTNQGTLEYIMGRRLSPKELAEQTEQKEAAYRDLCLAQGERFCLSPGAEALLDFLLAHNIPRTIATSSEEGNVQFFFQHLQLNRWFAIEQVSFDDGTIPGKPAPDLYLRAAANLHCAPAACVVIEDAHSGVLAAQNAGIGMIVALGPKARHAELAAWPGVHMVIENLAEFPRSVFRS